MRVGARLTDEIAPAMYNYGHLQVAFDDGSVGWYEAGWGPMISETAFFVKDMIGPKGCRVDRRRRERRATRESADHDTHTKTNALRVHHAALGAGGALAKRDEIQRDGGRARPSGALRARAAAVPEGDPRRGRSDGARADAINSLRIVFAADESMRTGEVVRL